MGGGGSHIDVIEELFFGSSEYFFFKEPYFYSVKDAKKLKRKKKLQNRFPLYTPFVKRIVSMDVHGTIDANKEPAFFRVRKKL